MRSSSRPFIRATERESPATSDGSELGSVLTNSNSSVPNLNASPDVNRNLNAKKRSETMPDNLWSASGSGSGGRNQPTRPFVTRESPATSSTGDSVPVTPRDGSDLGSAHTVKKRNETIATNSTPNSTGGHVWSGGASGLGLGKGGKHVKRHSVGFEDDVVIIGGGEKKRPSGLASPGKVVEGEEERRKERRRGEARAAIEVRTTRLSSSDADPLMFCLVGECD